MLVVRKDLQTYLLCNIKWIQWKQKQKQNRKFQNLLNLKKELNKLKKEKFNLIEKEYYKETKNINHNINNQKNNRKILKAFQSKIVAGLKNGAYEKANEIKAGTSALKDIEAIVNPKPENNININNTNAQQTNIEVENMNPKQITNAYLDIIKK